jgi:hypothetical protein
MATKTQAPQSAPATSLINEAAEATRDLFTYPPASVPSSGGDVTASSSSAAPTSLTQLAGDTIRQALGWRYRPDDVRGFAAALGKAITLTPGEDGQVDWKWTPQSAGVQADMGEITGAQASVLEQARVSIGYILPLLDGLKPLRVDADPEDIQAVTSIVRMKLNAILDELSRSGGPRVQRLDLIFEELLGIPIVQFSPGAALAKSSWELISVADSDDWMRQLQTLDAGHQPKRAAYSLLRQLCEEYGLEPQLANTVEEERDLTNALIIVDTIVALRTAWVGKRAYFDRADHQKPRFLGTQLVWLSRQLDVVSETVREAYAAMDSVYFGRAERDATDIYFHYKTEQEAHEYLVLEEKRRIKPIADLGEVTQRYETPAAPLSVGELLEWVETFATQEGPQLLTDAGKDGVLAFRSTVTRLTEWVHAAREFAQRGTGRAPRSFFTSRVEYALREIETQLSITAERAQGISRTTRDTPATGEQIADLPQPPAAKVVGVGINPRPAEPRTPGYGAINPLTRTTETRL